jgi:hypothetical protein
MKKLFSNSIMYFLPVEDTDLVSKRKLIGDTPHKAGVSRQNEQKKVVDFCVTKFTPALCGVFPHKFHK